jgi:hypothetical protein
MMEIRFKRTVGFLGRNGYYKMIGIVIRKIGDDIYLEPTTSKNETGRASLEIPTESITDFIDALTKIHNGKIVEARLL